MLDQSVFRSEPEMQDRYAGDVGDFVKLGLLRAISPGYALGLAWYHEAKALADGRCAVVYHHNTRRRGGHDAEVDYWLAQFGVHAIAVRATAYSPRTFFILNPTPKIEERVRDFCIKWRAIKVRIHDLRR
jgi:hypothetical protein